MSRLSAKGVRLSYGAVEVLKGVDLELRDGILVLLGPSGCGKTTLLRCIAGLETPSEGRISIARQPVFDAADRCDVPTDRRNLGIVFQSYALWPHRTVYDNVAYGLKLRKIGQQEIRQRTRSVLRDLGLLDYEDRFPHQLSGGQQQRVAIARSVVYEPTLLLLDEPLSNLDAQMREDAKAWLKRTIKRFGLSAVMVTHDQSEAMALGDEVVLMGRGSILQRGTPHEIYNRPEALEVATFFGSNNVFQGELRNLPSGSYGLKANGIELAGVVHGKLSEGEQCVAVARVECFTFSPVVPASSRLACALVSSMYMGSYWEHILRLADQSLIRVRSEAEFRTGLDSVHVPSSKVWIFPSGVTA